MIRRNLNLHKAALVAIFILLTFGLTLSVYAQVDPSKILQKAPSQKEYPDEDAAIMLDKGTLRLSQKGTVTIRSEIRIKVFTRQGKKDYGEVRIPFSSKLEKITINYARTINPDGEVIKPDEEAIREITHPAVEAAPIYSDIKLKVISMPGLQKGSIIDYSYTIKREPMMEDQLFGNWFFKTSSPVIHSRYTVKLPKERKLYWKVINGDFNPKVTVSDQTRVYSWKVNDLERIYEEPGRPSTQVISPRIVLSTLKDWQKIASWYQGLLEGRLEPDEEIITQVDQITQGLKSREEKIAQIYNWVATKVRYVALEFGLGRVQPYSVVETFHNRYGDCKDQSALLVSMLEQAGIEAHMALVKAGKAERTHFEGPATLGGFNHAIVAVSKPDSTRYLFLDPTCDVCNWEYLPDPDRGKKVLVIRKRKGDIVFTPSFDPTLSGAKTVLNAALSSAGDLEAEVDIAPQGKWSYIYRSFFQGHTEDEMKQIFQQVLSHYISGATFGKLEHSDPEDNFAPVTLNLSYKKDGYAQETAGLIILKPPPTLRIPFSLNFSYYTSKKAKERKYPVLMTPASYQDLIKIKIPEGYQPRLPEGKHKENSIASYTSRYKFEDGTITIERNFTVKQAVIEDGPPYSQIKEVVEVMREDEEEQIVLQ